MLQAVELIFQQWVMVVRMLALESVEEPPCSFCKNSFSSGNKKSIPGFPTKNNLLLSDLCHVDLDES